jgi:hypothetical protein
MALLSLREAAERAGSSKSTIFRYIKSGRLSASRGDDGAFQIDPAELARVFTPQPSHKERAGSVSMERDGMAVWDDLKSRNAALEEKVRGLEALLAEVRSARDLAQEQNRQILAGLAAPPARRSFWPWRKAG